MMDQEEDHFGEGWKILNDSTRHEAVKEYKYHTATELQGMPYLGQLTFYSGGGYPVLFKGTEEHMFKLVNRLKEGLWIDELTRAVFVEFTIYNPNSNLFSVNTFLVEFPSTTGAITTYRFEPVDLLGGYHSNAMLYEICCQIGFAIFIVYYTIHEIRAMIQMKKEYFVHLWNWNELTIIVLSYMGTVIFFYRLYLTKDLVQRFLETKGMVYIKFQYVASWHEMLSYIIGILVFLANLKFIKLLRFNKRMSLLGSTLRESRNDLFNFGIMFSILFFAYVQLFYLLFLRYLIGYKTVVASAETNMNIMLGKFNFQDMLNASPVLAPVFFFLYVVTMVMIVINMFISILCEWFTIVKNDMDKQTNDFEMVDFIFGRFKTWAGMGKPVTDDDLNNTKLNIEGTSPPFEVQIDNFPHKVDKLLNSISKVYFDNDNIDALFDPSKMSGNKDLYKNLLKNNSLMDKNTAKRVPAGPLPEVEETDLKKNP